MVGYVDINAALQSIKAAKEMFNAVIGVRDGKIAKEEIWKVKEAFGNALEITTSLQEERTAILKRLHQLEDEIANMKKWDGEKEKYELKNVSLIPRVEIFAYARKESPDSSGPLHNLCAQCYHEGKKSILQGETRNPGICRVLMCHLCGSDLYIAGRREPSHVKSKRK